MAWDAGAEPEQGYRSGSASVGVFQLADCVVGDLQPATKLPSSRRGAQVSNTGAQRNVGLVTWAVAVAWAVGLTKYMRDVLIGSAFGVVNAT